DILWQNSNGQPGIWLMDGFSIKPGGAVQVGPNSGPSWHVVGTGDFDGDGKSDILWQNSNGQPGVWLMDGTSVKTGAAVTVAPNAGPSGKVIGWGDLEGDGNSDILWQNDNGQAGIWLTDGISPKPGAMVAVGANPGPSWNIVGTGDFDGDGKSAIL